MHTLVHVAAAVFACAWIGAAASSQTPSPDWSGFPGPAVSSAGDVNGDGFVDVIVGGYGFSNPQVEEGRACIYLGSPTGLEAPPAWTVEGNQAGASFGWEVAGVGDVNGDGFDDVLVGAPYFDDDQGRACLYLGSPTGPSTTPTWTQDGPATSYLGWDLAAAGDVNGDGLDDVIIGVPGDGAAVVWHGSPSGALVWTWQALGSFGVGNVVSGAGDVNGDGFDDVMVSEPWDANGGTLYVFPGTSGGPSLTQYWVLESGVQPLDYEFGRRIAPAGDLDGDGFGDIAVYSGNPDLLGRVSVFRGSSAGPTLTWSFTGAHDSFGWGLAAGDVNGDGYDDLIVGAPEFDVTPQGGQGRAIVYEGSSAGLTQAWMPVGYLGEHFGMAVGAADINGDGYCDMLVTDDPFFDGNGSVHAYRGSRFGLNEPPRHRRAPRAAEPRFP